jgi:hypothetical protein
MRADSNTDQQRLEQLARLTVAAASRGRRNRQLEGKTKRLDRDATKFLARHGFKDSDAGESAVGRRKVALNRRATDLHARYLSEGWQYRCSFETFKKNQHTWAA